MFFYGMYAKLESPKAATFIWGAAAIFLSFYANVALTNGIETTPFQPIDGMLAKIDLWFSINTPALLAWLHQHQTIHKVISNIYHSLTFELLIIPVALASLNARKTLRIFLNAQLSSFFIGAIIYYFFPTTAPSGEFHSPYFSLSQMDTSMRFYQVHHFLKVSTADGGLIAFPSFHVVWAILLTYCTLEKKWIFYPLAIYNLILIASTVILGWHYLADVIAGVMLAFSSLYFGRWYEKYPENK